MLDKAGTHKRKRSVEGTSEVGEYPILFYTLCIIAEVTMWQAVLFQTFHLYLLVETAGQQIVRELTEKYIDQLNQTLSVTREEYKYVCVCCEVFILERIVCREVFILERIVCREVFMLERIVCYEVFILERIVCCEVG